MRRVTGLLVAVTLLTAAACSTGNGAGKQSRRASTPSTTKVPPVAPLTGLPDPSGVAQTRPALWVKIENLPVARPQSGLDVADVVYEIVVNGGITRFAAAFQSASADRVGPIRSVRPMDPSIVTPLGGIFAYSGGLGDEVRAIEAVPSLHVIEETAAGDAMFRIRSRAVPHNLYGATDALWALGGRPAPPPPLFTYAKPNAAKPGGSCAGEPVTSFTIPFDATYGQPSYAWNAATRSWARSYGGTPHAMENGQPIAPANVIVQFVQYTPEPGVDGGDAIPTGQGEAWVFCGGTVVKGRWVRPDVANPARFVDAAGKPIALTPGRTWVELVPAGATLAVVSPPPPAAPPTTTTLKKKQ